MREKPGFLKRYRAYWLKWKYGITAQERQAMLDIQGGKCAICRRDSETLRRPGKRRDGKEPLGLVVDHNHETKEVRGLLCNRCNRAIGLFDDDPGLLMAAAVYLKQPSDLSDEALHVLERRGTVVPGVDTDVDR